MLTWLCVQLDDDERVARAATPGPWMWIAGRVYQEIDGGRTVISTDQLDRAVVERQDIEHIGRNNPAHVLRVIAAHRAIIDLYEELNEPHLYEALTRLASIYADRSGYDPAWKAS